MHNVVRVVLGDASNTELSFVRRSKTNFSASPLKVKDLLQRSVTY